MSNDPEYMRRYMLRRYHARRRSAIRLLGGKCSSCGSRKGLQFDHTDPKQKGFSVARLWGVSEARWLEEIAKCQLHCGDCHNKKTVAERGFKIAKGNHGTISTYRYCHCPLCKEAKRQWSRNHKSPSSNGSG